MNESGMMQHRFMPQERGAFDEAIEWLLWFEGVLAAWRDGSAITGALSQRHNFSRCTHAVTFNGRTSDPSRMRINEQEWLPVELAHKAFIASVERWATLTPTEWDRHIEHVKEVRQWCQKHNPPEEKKVWY